MKNPKEELRRRALRHIIRTDKRWLGNVSAFAREAKKKQSQIADMLSGRKRFGEKIARDLERAVKLPAGALDVDLGNLTAVQHATERLEHSVVYGSPISSDAAEIGREWEKLQEPLRAQIADLIHTLAAQVGEQSRPPPRSRTSKREDAPHPRA